MCLLGCDIGSSSVKASIVDKDTGLTLASDFYPKEEAAIKAVRPGWAEQNPDDWWMYLKEAIKGAIAKAGIKGTDCLLYTSPSLRDPKTSRMPSSA